MLIPRDKLTLHNEDFARIGWFDMPQGDPPRGSIAVVEINHDAVQQRENADLNARIARQRDYENRLS